ncbi:hypothetical protein [Carnobacterium sp.]|uniref:hypothetical protein n=1 Tax=Carnobacterium sp. TaxID=48221 RepID=UPI0028A616A5|nr:hypothetical protein [Carnobacterium sp.]
MKIGTQSLLFGLVMGLFRILQGKSVGEIFLTFIVSALGALITLYIYKDGDARNSVKKDKK